MVYVSGHQLRVPVQVRAAYLNVTQTPEIERSQKGPLRRVALIRTRPAPEVIVDAITRLLVSVQEGEDKPQGKLSAESGNKKGPALLNSIEAAGVCEEGDDRDDQGDDGAAQ